MQRKKNILTLFTLACLIAASAAVFYIWHPVGASEAASADMAMPPALPVDIAEVKAEPVQVWKKFSGRVVAVDQADIRPQVSGRITEIRFENGRQVEQGDVLVVIDPRPYEAALAQAKAALAAAQTEASLAEKEYQRAKELIESEAISQRIFDERANRRQVAAAAVESAKAQVATAEINLDYAFVKAPISGKISRAELTVGNLVQAGPGAPLLTSIVADDQVYVDFEVDDQTYVGLMRENGSAGNLQIPVRLQLASGDIEIDGFVQSFDNSIDPASGTIRARAVFVNEQKLLLPGMSVSVMMGSPGNTPQILVSERAIGTDQDRKFVYVVNGDNLATYREVKIGDSIEGKRIILAGLEEGEKVIADGIVRIRPNMLVAPKPLAQPEPAGMNQPEETVAEPQTEYGE